MPPPSVVICVEDGRYYKKFFRSSPTATLKKLLDAYRSHLCKECSNAGLLEFWSETTKVNETHTPQSLNLKDGDIIDVRIPAPCTRGACPLPPEQSLPNIHYLATALTTGPVVEEEATGPTAPKRITLKIRDLNGFEIVLRLKAQTPLRHAMTAFAAQVKREVRECRFLVDGQRVVGNETPESLDMLDEDLIEVVYEVTGG